MGEHGVADRSLKGSIGPFMATCDTIGIENFQTWRILHRGFTGRLLAIYLTDLDVQEFVNHFDFKRLPVLRRGRSKDPESVDPVLIDGKLQVRPTQFYQVFGIDGKFLDEQYQTYSFVVSLTVKNYPNSGQFETILSFITDIKVDIQVDSDGRLRVYAGQESVFMLDGVSLGQLDQGYQVIMHYGRPRIDESNCWCSVMVQVLGQKEAGGTFDCEFLPKSDF